ncbi:BON domain-containing protein [Streptomyces sp. NPDC048504]|uniref:BON domain-containing protein n=1 Tax=Streptomyces sp. NPDC048504 TaxID=3365559 RepID=UPI00371574DE
MSRTKDVRQSVEAELVFDPLVDATDITVHNLGGEVRLTGTVPSYLQYLEAATAAQRVAGVTKVHNNLEVVLSAAHERDDATLAETANTVLLINIAVPVGVEATADNGDVTLTGVVRYGSERQAAEQAVAGLAGVRGIKNKIEIADDADPVDVTLLVSDALDRNALILDDSEVDVTTNANTVVLAGHVRTWAEHDAVVAAAWMAPGVYDVRDDLYITG